MEWWKINKGYDGLHALNPIRIEFIRDVISKTGGSIAGSTALDVGCGGGILTEPLYNLGFDVTGIDIDIEALKSGRLHNPEIEFLCMDVADVEGEYDYVFALEVIEHTQDPENFVKHCRRLAKKAVFFSTLNRNAKSFLAAIVLAEWVCGFVKLGTHQWGKFVKPDELVHMCDEHGLNLVDIKGLKYSPFHQTWAISKDDVSVNYIAAFVL